MKQTATRSSTSAPVDPPVAPPTLGDPKTAKSSQKRLQKLPPLALVRAEQARRSLKEFIRQGWSIIEPTTSFIGNWHIDVLCEHLEAITQGRLLHLLVNIPPRQMKSTIVSVMWPAWEWITQPGLKYLTASYRQELATRDAGKSRLLMQSSWYQSLWKTSFKFRTDQDSKSRYENDKGGLRVALSTESGGTGDGGDRLIYDDPHSLKDSQSQVALKSAIDFWTSVMGSRGNSDKTARVVIMQRSSPDDLSGYLLKDPRYEVICLPLEYDGQRRKTCLGAYDPRRQLGELLWPERFGPEAVANLKKDLRAFGTNAQLQQAPSYRGSEATSGILEAFRRYQQDPRNEVLGTIIPTQGFKIHSWDTMYIPGSSNAFNACVCAEVNGDGLSIYDVQRKQSDYYDLKREVLALIERDQPAVVLIEFKASGISLYQDLQREPGAATVSLVPVEPKVSKEVRWAIEAELIRSGKVHLPEVADWLVNYESEVVNFPNGVTRDQVDATSQLLWYWQSAFSAAMAPSFAFTGVRTFGRSTQQVVGRPSFASQVALRHNRALTGPDTGSSGSFH